jgi:hypothetical protein
MEDPLVVVVVELQREDEGGLCWTLLIGAGAATVVVVAMDGEMGSPNAGTHYRNSTTPGRRTEKA